MKKEALSISILWIGSLLGAALVFLTQIIIARSLKPAEYGIFASLFAIASLLVPLASFGVAQYWLKEFGKQGWAAKLYIEPSLKFVFLSTFVVAVMLVLWALIGPHDAKFSSALILLIFYVAGQVALELVAGKLQLEGNYYKLAWWQFFPHLMRLVLVISFVYIILHWVNVVSIASLFGAAGLFFCLMGFREFVKIARGDFVLEGHDRLMADECFPSKVSIKTILNGAWPFGLAGIFHLIYFQSDIVLVKYITGDEAAGFYNVAFTIMVAVLLFPGIVYQKFLLPKIHRWAYHDRVLFYKVYRQGNLVMFCLGIVAMVMLWMLAPIAVPLFFGADYLSAIELLMILALSAPILFVASSVGAVLVTKEHMKTKVKLMGAVAIINILLNLVLIPPYGAKGAAVATVISNFVLLAFYYATARGSVFLLESLK